MRCNMGFWSSAGKVALDIGKGMLDTGKLLQEYKLEDDKFLEKQLSRGDSNERLAAKTVLESRGYTVTSTVFGYKVEK